MLSAHLQDLQRCLETKLISPEEHEQLRKRILGEFPLLAAHEHGSGTRLVSRSGPSATNVANAHSLSRVSLAASSPIHGPCASPSETPLLRERDTLQEGEFWCKFIREHIRMLKAADPGVRHDKLTMADLHAFDVSGDRVREVFRLYDENQDGQITAEELVSGLERWNRKIDLEWAEELIRHIIWQCRQDRESFSYSGHASLTELEFKLLLQRLRLGELFTPSAGVFQFEEYSSERPLCPVWVSDYARTRCSSRDLRLGQKEDVRTALQLFFGSRAFRTGRSVLDSIYRRDVRWIHIDATHGLDRLTLFRYAAKYHLHPLAVDDIIDNRTPTKLDRFEDHYFLSVDILALAADHGRGARHRVPPRVRIHRCNASIFLSQAPECDTVLTILQNRPDESSWMAMWRRSGSSTAEVMPDNTLWDTLREDMQQIPPQVMREKRGDFLVYEILSRVMDQLRPISAAYAKRLGYMRQTPPGQYPQEWLSELDEVQLELRDMTRSIRPMRQVLRHLIDDRSLTDTTMYFEDVEDGINEMLEDIVQLQEMGKTVEDDHEVHRERKMNQTLYVLSVVSCMFLPGQFVTGVYGMNFVDEDGHPTMPELLWDNGYLYFWVLELCLFAFGLALFVHFTGRGLGHQCARRAAPELPRLTSKWSVVPDSCSPSNHCPSNCSSTRLGKQAL